MAKGKVGRRNSRKKKKKRRNYRDELFVLFRASLASFLRVGLITFKRCNRSIADDNDSASEFLIYC